MAHYGRDRATAEWFCRVLPAAAVARSPRRSSINRDASRWRKDLGLAPVFETARMYTSAIPPLRLERVFGVTTFELGVVVGGQWKGQWP